MNKYKNSNDISMSNEERQRRISHSMHRVGIDPIKAESFGINSIGNMSAVFPSGLPKDFLNKAFIEGEIIIGKFPPYLNGNSYDS